LLGFGLAADRGIFERDLDFVGTVSYRLCEFNESTLLLTDLMVFVSIRGGDSIARSSSVLVVFGLRLGFSRFLGDGMLSGGFIGTN
jgi:hypothetical protein